MKLRACIFGLLLAALAVCMPSASAQDGFRGALSQVGHELPGGERFGRGLAAADFDNDSQPDGAVLSQAGWLNGQRRFRIDLHVTAGKDVSITFPSVEPDLDISAVDVNRDGAPDLVVERPFSHQRVQVYLNDGYGAFQRAEASSFPAPENSLPLWRARMNPLNLPMACLPVTRAFELASINIRSTVFHEDGESACFWPQVLIAQCGPRAPSSSRAPPFLLTQ